MPDLSVVIVSWQTSELLKKCLQSLRLATGISLEVIVVDNNSNDDTVSMIQRDFPEVVLLPQKTNLGFAKANNLGLKASSGQYLLLLNPDTEVMPDCLAKSLNYLKTNPEVGCLGCQLLNTDKTVQPSVRNFPWVLDYILMTLKLQHFSKFYSLFSDYFQINFDYQKTKEVEQVMGAFMMIPKVVYEKTGDLDEDFFTWFEEVDYCQRIINNRKKIVYFAPSQCIHHGGASFSQVQKNSKHWRWLKSRLTYVYKNQSLITFVLVLILTPIDQAIHYLISLFYEPRS